MLSNEMNRLVKKINKNQIALAFTCLFLLTLRRSVSSYFGWGLKRPEDGRFLIAGRDRALITPKPYYPPGVLNSEQIKELSQDGVLERASGEPIEPEDSSIDLHISNHGWKLRGSVKQIKGEGNPKGSCVQSICEKYMEEEIKLTSKGQHLEKGNVYVFLLEESVDFSIFPFLYGEATGKSSIGRIDVLTRLLADGLPSYDYIEPPYKGPLYVEVIPMSFNLIVYPTRQLEPTPFSLWRSEASRSSGISWSTAIILI
jgi:hypothetical protein